MEQKQARGRVFFQMRHRLCQAILTLAFLALLVPQALAFTVDNTNYIFYQDKRSPTYQIALQAMKDVYARFPWDKVPLIGIAELDLNGDKLPEIIAFPTEEMEQEGDYCNKDTLCPHYILDASGKKVRNIGIIYSRYISRGDDIRYGYWTLKVWNKGEKDPSYFDIYAYDPKKGVYAPAPKKQ